MRRLLYGDSTIPTRCRSRGLRRDPSLTDAWDLLVRLAESGAGWPEPSREDVWAAGPDDLAGSGGELAKVLAHGPTRRLVVLGDPEAGKTMLMVRLVLDLLARRAVGGQLAGCGLSVAQTERDLVDRGGLDSRHSGQ